MATVAVTALSALVRQVQDMYTAYKEISEIIDKLPSDVEILGSRLKLYEEAINNHGVQAQVNDCIVVLLQKAKSKLLDAESKMKYLEEIFHGKKTKAEKGAEESMTVEQSTTAENTCCLQLRWMYAKLYIIWYASTLDKTMKTVNGYIDEMLKILEDQKKLKTILQQDADSQPHPITVFNNDELYVPIQDSEKKVLTAIENGPRIVLLHGGVGKGKSTLARHVCQLYGPFGERKNEFQYVLLVNCAGSSGLNPSNKKHEILRSLPPDTISSISPESENRDFNRKIAESLRAFYRNGQKILIILDDVSDDGVMLEMLRAASEGETQVKYLVTSQYPNLCANFQKDSLAIAMGIPDDDEAMQILASLVGLDDKIIPENFKETAFQMIHATERNPLALACLASSLAPNKTSLRAWKETYRSLRGTLDQDDTSIVLGQGRDFARSLWAATKICMDSLKNRDAKEILFLLYSCKGESIPEEVLRILHTAISTSSGTFLKSIEELRLRELLKCTPSPIALQIMIDDNNQTNIEQPVTWSLLTTVKLYIDHYMATEEKMRSLFNTLLGGDDEIKMEPSVKCERDSEIQAAESEKTKVATTLCALYLDPGHTEEVVVKAATRACIASKIDWDATIKDRKRKAVEPLIWLLDQLEEEDRGWTDSTISCARQVFLKYICERELDDQSICVLLKLTSYPSAPLATLTALSQILQIEEKPLLNNDNLTCLTPLLHLLKSNKDVHPTVQQAASIALYSIFRNSQNDETKELSGSIVKSRPDVLSLLVRCLKDSAATGLASRSGTLTLNAARTLWCLSCDGGDSTRLQILSEVGALPALVRGLLMEEYPILQTNVAGILVNLSVGERSYKKIIVNQKGAVAGLVQALSKGHNPDFQIQAARALANLASGEESTKDLIVSQEGAIAALVQALRKDYNPVFQTEAARALANLAEGTESTRKVIVNQKGAIAGLMQALSQEKNPKFQAKAASALGNLAFGEESMRKLILNKEGPYAGLVTGLENEGNPDLQERAAKIFANLAQMFKMRFEERLMASLMKCAAKEDNPGLQAQAKRALKNGRPQRDLSGHDLVSGRQAV